MRALGEDGAPIALQSLLRGRAGNQSLHVEPGTSVLIPSELLRPAFLALLPPLAAP